MLTDKQLEFITEGNRRFNIKTGATRSGKTYLDILHTIPERVREREGEAGLNVIFGVTNGTIQRNILNPMAEIWGSNLVGNISSKNTVQLFNEEVHIIGAEKVTSVSKIRGTSIKYAYCDEIAEFNKEAFELIKSRLDKEYSILDGTCNPDHPNHYIKKFLESNADIYEQHYHIDDNKFNPPEFVENLKREYEGTIYYDRYINGLWVRAEGIIYRKFADNPEMFESNLASDIMGYNIGVDFGGSGSKHAFVATALLSNYRGAQVIKSERLETDLDPAELNEKLVKFIKEVTDIVGFLPDNIYCDSAEQVLIRGIKTRIMKEGWPSTVRDAWKTKINDRIGLTTSLLGLNRLTYTKHAESFKTALSEAVWDSKVFEIKRLDNGTTDIDTLDAYEYSLEPYAKRLLRR